MSDLVRQSISLAITLILCISSTAGAQVLQTDKAAHFGMSAVGTISTIKLLNLKDTQSKLGVAAIWILIGLAKEATDDRVDKGDIVANVSGVFYGYKLSLDWSF